MALLCVAGLCGRHMYAGHWRAHALQGCRWTVVEYAGPVGGDGWRFDRPESCGRPVLSGARDVRWDGGALSFTTTERTGIQWGDFVAGGRPLAFKAPTVEVEARQDRPEMVWTFIPSTSQPGRPRPRVRTTVKGTDWQRLRVRLLGEFCPLATGLRIEWRGQPGARISLRRLSCRRVEWRGWFVRRFSLPSEPLKALVAVSSPAGFWVNGQRVQALRRAWGAMEYATTEYDITGLLRRGQNVLAIEARRRHEAPPFVFLQGSVVCRDGTVVKLDTGPGWQYSPSRPADGWQRPEFKTQGWPPAPSRPVRPSTVGYFLADHQPPDESLLRVPAPDNGEYIFGVERGAAFDVTLPAPYATKQSIAYRVLDGWTEKEIARGMAPRQKIDGGCPVYRVVFGPRQPGTFFLELAAGEAPKLRREIEFAVVGPIRMPRTSGASFTDGLELELVDTIRCTDPADPHRRVSGFERWSEKDRSWRWEPAAAQVVRTALGPFLATPAFAGRRGWGYSVPYFAYALHFGHPGEPHLIEVDYPDDERRLIQISVGPYPQQLPAYVKSRYYKAQTQVAVITGEPWRASGTVKTLRFFYFPKGPDHTLVVSCNEVGTRAAVREIRVYRVVGDIPELTVRQPGRPQRLFGLHFERSWIPLATYYTGPNWSRLRYLDWHCRRYRGIYRDFYQAFERMVQRMKFYGENALTPGGYMYFSPYWPTADLPGLYVPRFDYLALLARMFEENGLRFFLSLEYYGDRGLQDLPGAEASRYEVARGARTIWCVGKDGDVLRPALKTHPLGPPPSPFNEAVRARVRKIIIEGARRYAKYRSFGGWLVVVHPCWFGAVPAPAHDYNRFAEYGYEDAAIQAFQKATGITVPVAATGPQRFGKRYEWLRTNAWDEWLAWRCRVIAQMHHQTAQELLRLRPDLSLYVMGYFDRYHIAKWVEYGRDFRRVMVEWGLAPQLYRREDGARLVPLVYQVPRIWRDRPQRFEGGEATAEDCLALNTHPSALRALPMECRRNLYVMAHFVESFVKARDPKWPWDTFKLLTYPRPAGDNEARVFAEAMAFYDPQVIFYGWCDTNVAQGRGQAYRHFLQAYRCLPAMPFERVAAVEGRDKVAVRAARVGRRLVFYVVNLTADERDVQVRFSQRPRGLRDRVTGHPISTRGRAAAVRLRPYETRVFEAQGNSVRVTGAKAQ